MLASGCGTGNRRVLTAAEEHGAGLAVVRVALQVHVAAQRQRDSAQEEVGFSFDTQYEAGFLEPRSGMISF